MELRPGSGGLAGELSLETSLEPGRVTMANREDAAEQVRRLYEEHYDAVYRYLYLSGSSPTDADEFIQEAFLRMLQAFRDGIQIETPRNWLLRVAHNLRCDESRQAHRRDDYDEQRLPLSAIVDPAPNAETRMAHEEQLADLRAAMAQLTERQSQFLLLRAEGMKLKDIAEMYGITIQSVAQSCERAMDRLGRLTHE